MAKVPADRFATAAEFSEALTLADREEGQRPAPARQPGPRFRARRTGIVVAAVGLAAVVAAGAVLSRGKQERSAQITSLAVLPLANTTPDTSIEYLEDGLTETLINGLSNIPNLRVTARSAAFRYRGKSTDPSKIGRELGVQAAPTWSLRRHGDRLRSRPSC